MLSAYATFYNITRNNTVWDPLSRNPVSGMLRKPQCKIINIFFFISFQKQKLKMYFMSSLDTADRYYGVSRKNLNT